MICSFRQLLPLTAGLLFAHAANAQYTTPGSGQAYTLSDLVAVSGGVITANSATSYQQTADFTLAANDTLVIDSNLDWAVDPSASISIFGTFSATPPYQATITASDSTQFHGGIRFEDGSSIHLDHMIISYGGGIKSLTNDLVLSYCFISNQVTNATTGAALELSDGKVYLDHVTFSANESAAISSAANGEAAPQITHCNFYQNGYANTNRPQINLGPSGADTTVIRNCTVLGDPANTMVGGIAFSSLVGGPGHVIIDSNIVNINRYGIALIGNNITGLITNNTVADNNTQNNPAQGGSGINLYGGSTNVSVVSGNKISGNLWGITLQSAVTTNLGDTAAANYNPGGNSFANNGNGGVTYALYNNTPNPVPAMNNCWDFMNPPTDSTLVAAVVFDVADDGTLGEVFFMPFSNCGIVTAIGETPASEAVAVFPNPSNGQVTVHSTVSIDNLSLFNAKGQLVRTQRGPVQGPWSLGDLETGLYLLKATTPAGVEYIQRIVVE
ncbi:MAG: T9SS type A sorting domain-containing protein [Bacteroidetes bacterium]|nr:T9SS type A sorting domain-containing protein [Bacteroidota bacterium]